VAKRVIETQRAERWTGVRVTHARRAASAVVLGVTLSLIVAWVPWRMAVLTAHTVLVAPGPWRVPGGHDRYWDVLALQDQLAMSGWTVSYETPVFIGHLPVYGVTNSHARAITVDSTLGWNARLAVLSHEAGHAWQPPWFSPSQGQAFAESVSALVSRDGYREHARYLAWHKSDLLFVAIFEHARVYRVARILRGE
jgi:hypothetical protein